VIVHNADVAQVFWEIADLLEIKGENPFRIRAYRNAARTVNALGESVQAMVAQDEDLCALPGIGADLAQKIVDIVNTGTCAAREQLRQEMPPAIHELLKVPTLGPKRVRTLYQALNIESPAQLLDAALGGHISGVRGFGRRAEQRIVEALQARQVKKPGVGIAQAEPIARALQAFLQGLPQARDVVVAGSFRRRRDIVGDLDIVVTSPDARELIARFVDYGDVAHVLAHGGTRASVVLLQGMQVDLRVVPQVSFGAALHYFTGSKAHNIAMRTLAQQRGLKLNEYGVFSGARRIAGETEQSVFAALGLPFIAPELRENQGEIAAAQAGALPALLVLDDLRGDLHAHTKASDGRSSLRAMAEQARRRGLSYLAITDYTHSLAVAHGLDAQRLARQGEEIDRLNAELKDITLLKGAEVDIMEDGSLDLPDAVLEGLDVVLGAVHSHFGLPRERQTERILRAMDHPCFGLLAHPTGRLLFERPPYDVDMPRIIRHARRRGCFLELDAQPSRLDLNELWCRMAKDEGVLVCINSDAHSTLEFDYLHLGVGQARRGWLAAEDVLNTRGLDQLLPMLAQRRRVHG
jgi:DNA polymerase (family X)